MHGISIGIGFMTELWLLSWFSWFSSLAVCQGLWCTDWIELLMSMSNQHPGGTVFVIFWSIAKHASVRTSNENSFARLLPFCTILKYKRIWSEPSYIECWLTSCLACHADATGKMFVNFNEWFQVYSACDPSWMLIWPKPTHDSCFCRQTNPIVCLSKSYCIVSHCIVL